MISAVTLFGSYWPVAEAPPVCPCSAMTVSLRGETAVWPESRGHTLRLSELSGMLAGASSKSTPASAEKVWYPECARRVSAICRRAAAQIAKRTVADVDHLARVGEDLAAHVGRDHATAGERGDAHAPLESARLASLQRV